MALKRDGASSKPEVMGREQKLDVRSFKFVTPASKYDEGIWLMTKVKQNVHNAHPPPAVELLSPLWVMI